MITLDGSTELVQIQLALAVTTTELDWKTSWDDNDDAASLFTFGQTDGVTTGTTPVTVVPSPAAGVQRNTKRINVFNRDTVNAEVTVTFFNGAASRFLGCFVLEPNWSLVYESCHGWTVYDEMGIPQSSAGGGGGPHAVTHEDGGSDEVNVVGLSGLLADAQTPLAHAPTHQDGGTDELEVETQPTTETDTSKVLKPDGVGGLAWGDAPAGGASLAGQWEFKSATGASDPGSGNFRLNNATQPSATAIYISSESKPGVDWDGLLGRLNVGDTIYMQEEEDATRFHVAVISADPTDNGVWHTLPITMEDSGANLTDGKECGLIFVATGVEEHDIEGDRHTLSGAAAGEVMAADSATTFSFQGREFSRGAVFIDPANLISGAEDAVIWRAPFACTVTNVRGYRDGGTGATINARRNGTSEHLSSDLSLTSLATWQDGGAVQNTAYAAGDSLELRLKTHAGDPVFVTVQVDFTRP